ncbi:class I SAM-dependent methyltransferase [Marilutibacter alkalisoli]|uniref:SAM-dependent methyltransferase n=1 Tax=Marilutibacter alkalisoli TaxID=2591633 RepID=A0A514BVG7_9GAMM|nr:SAM-dependent methyltransferase [Lysobacter alkalisoli]QDH71305.1 SAM-dependent methyltransferase [Lysobacter alkalisoli]
MIRLPIAIALVSMAALAYQLLLMRWLAIAHWHSFAVVIISLALLGHGASGTWLSLFQGVARKRFDIAFPACALLFTATAVAMLWLVWAIPFNGLELVWNPRQWLWLGALYLALALPFGFAASCFGLAFARHGGHIPMLYGADLLGAGLGALAAIALQWLPVEHGLLLALCCGPLAAVVAAARRQWRWVLPAALVTSLLLPGHVPAPQVNEYKGLSTTRLLPDTSVLVTRNGPYGRLDVLESPRVPLRHAPGLSLANVDEPSPQLGVFTDGDGLSVIVRDDGDAESLAWSGRMTSALPYRLKQAPTVLVLGAGGGMEVLQALALGARTVDAVELDPGRVRLVRDDFADFAGHLYHDPRVRLHVAEPRAFARADRQHYDVVVLAGAESFAAGGAGVLAASEQYALTVGAIREYLARLAPGGVLVATRWSQQPPRAELRLFATMIEALRAEGVDDPQSRLTVLRNWDASTLLVKRDRFESDELAAIRGFAQEYGFDPPHLPGSASDETGHHHFGERDWLREGTQALLSTEADAFLRDYKFAISPVSDDMPYFGDFFRWRSLPELWRLREQGSAVLLDSGTLLLFGALAQAVPLSLLLVLLPLWALPRGGAGAGGGAGMDGADVALPRLRAGGYFFLLGLAFMLIEIASLSRLTLLVGHPLPAVAVGLGGFLLFAGAGSLAVQCLLVRMSPMRMTRWAVLAIALGLGWQFTVFATTHSIGASWPVAARALAGLIGIAPLAFAMGMPFPLGLARLARDAPAFVPWAWGINGCASVVAAIGALLLAMAIGLCMTLLVALALYVVAAWLWREGVGRSR